MQMFYTAQTALAHSVSSMVEGLANNSMTTAQRAALFPDDREYHDRYVSLQLRIENLGKFEFEHQPFD